MSDVPPIVPPVPVSPPYPWWVLPGLAAMILFIFGGALAATCFMDNDTLRTQMFTGAFGLATAAVAYFFGSSAGSQKKDDAAAVSMLKKDETIATNTAALAASVPAPPQGTQP